MLKFFDLRYFKSFGQVRSECQEGKDVEALAFGEAGEGDGLLLVGFLFVRIGIDLVVQEDAPGVSLVDLGAGLDAIDYRSSSSSMVPPSLQSSISLEAGTPLWQIMPSGDRNNSSVSGGLMCFSSFGPIVRPS